MMSLRTGTPNTLREEGRERGREGGREGGMVRVIVISYSLFSS